MTTAISDDKGGDERGTTGERQSVARLVLHDFRCHSVLRLRLTAQPVVLTGRNGSGKTSILEALSLLVPGRGLRRAHLDELAHRPAGAAEPSGPWAVNARLRTPAGPVDVATGAEGGGSGEWRRTVRIDGQAARNQSELAAVCAAVWLTPEMDRLFSDSASARRRFLDRGIYGIDAEHARRVSAYERAMGERARLLRERSADPLWLSALEDTMVTQGCAILAARQRMAAMLTAESQRLEQAFPSGTVTVVGPLEDWLDAGTPESMGERFRKSLIAARRADGEASHAPVGPHRSDMRVCDSNTGRDAKSCSTGEQKALLIGLCLASARMQAQRRQGAPLVLLDEVAAHLDAGRRAALFDVIGDLGAQAWYVGTDRAVFQPLRHDAQFIAMEELEVAGIGRRSAEVCQGAAQGT